MPFVASLTRAERITYVEQLLDEFDAWMFPKNAQVRPLLVYHLHSQKLIVVHAQGQVMWHLPLNNEAIITVIEATWFKDTSSFGRKQIHLFRSSLPADKYPKESKEPELPKPLIAVAATAVCN